MSQLPSTIALKAIRPPPARGVGMGGGVDAGVGEGDGVAVGALVAVAVAVGEGSGVAVDVRVAVACTAAGLGVIVGGRAVGLAPLHAASTTAKQIQNPRRATSNVLRTTFSLSPHRASRTAGKCKDLCPP
jgi:hypothetical protein